MKKNMGSIDRVIRIAFALAVGGMIFFEMISGVAAIVLGVFAAVFLITSFFAVCPIYTIMGISTRPGK
jgi:hypothetical protein